MVKSTGGKSGAIRFALTILFLAPFCPAQAAQFAYGLGYTATRSDNITRVPSTDVERGETVNSYLVGFSFLEESSVLLARVQAQAELRDYRENIYGDETISNLKSYLLWTISPQRFTWTVEDTLENTQITSTAADTPDNRTNVNVFNTGPDAYIRFNTLNTLALNARAGKVTTGKVDADNDRVSGSASWLYQSTPVSTYSLNVESLKVMFDDSTLNNDFANHDLFFRADYRPSRSHFVIDLGVTKIDPDRGETLDESLYRFSWIRELTQESKMGVSASGEFSDVGADILAASTSSVPLTSQTAGVITSDVYYTKRGSLFYSYLGTQVALDLSLFGQDLDFETTLGDRKETGGSLGLSFFYAGALTVTVFTEQVRTRYQDIVRRDTDRDTGIRFSYRISRNVSLGLEGVRSDRSSTDPADEFKENQAFFSILYSSSPLFSPAPTR